MDFDFEWYNPSIGTPMISLAGYGITFSRSAVNTMRTPAYVKLGFDKQRKLVGIMVCGKEDKNKFEFANREKNNNVRINSRDFIRLISSYMPDLIPNDNTTVRFTGVWDEKEGIMTIDLTAPLKSENNEDNFDDAE